MRQIAAVTLTGYLSAFLGALLGLAASRASKTLGRKGEGAVTGFTAGLLIAFVCFKILEEGFLAAPLYIGVAAILAGVFAAVWLEGISGGAPFAIALAVMLHNFPEGIALGGMLIASPAAGLLLAAAISVHCIPESAAVFIRLEKDGRGFLVTLIYAVLLSLPMACGSLLGAVLTEISGVFQAVSLTFSGGVMLYMSCGEMLPNSKRLWNGRLTTVCALLGFILGVVITA